MINLKSNEILNLSQDGIFYSSVGSIKSKCRTFVNLLIKDDTLRVSFECKDDEFIKFNNLHKNNEELFKQEVFEIFLSSTKNKAFKYLEIEINPNNAVYLSLIINPSSVGGVSKKNRLLDQHVKDLKHHVKCDSSSWTGYIDIPMQLIRKFTYNSSEFLKANFYRTVLNKKPIEENWVGDVSNTDYLCFNPTNSPNKPNFHIINSFVLFNLK